MSYSISSLYHFPIVIPDATPSSDGVMTKEQATQLARLAAGGAFSRTIVQPADGTDFVVNLPASLVQATTHFAPTVMIGTAGVFTGISVSFADNTLSSFRVTTDGVLPNGTVLLCSVQPFAPGV